MHPNQLFTWRRLLNEGALSAVKAGEPVVPASEAKGLRLRIRELERLLGHKTMEVEILKDAVRIAREKKLISRVPLLGKDDTR
jgi:transposase